MRREHNTNDAFPLINTKRGTEYESFFFFLLGFLRVIEVNRTFYYGITAVYWSTGLMVKELHSALPLH